MKNFSLVLNIVLIAAVGFLYYAFYSEKKGNTRSSVVIPAHGGDISTAPQIAYVELDSLNMNIGYIKEERRQLEAEQKSIEASAENGYRSLEAQKNDFIKKSGGNPSQADVQRIQESLMQQQQRIDNQKQQMNQQLSEKSFKFMEGFQKDLRTFLSEYNKDRRFSYIFTYGSGLDYMAYKDSAYNITNDVIKGMNEMKKPKN